MKNIIFLSFLFLLISAPTLAKATNESSYKYGFNNAVSDYESCYQGLSAGDCNVSSSDPLSQCYVGAGSGNVTNSTACTDGYMNGWKHWCNHNAKDCAELTTSDLFPGSLLSDNKTALANAKSLSYIAGTWNFVNISSSKNSNESESIGTLTLKNDGTAVEIGKYGQIIHGMVVCYNGKCGHDPTSSGSWYYDGQLLSLSYYGGPGVSFTVIKTSPTHIELKNDKGDTIHLMR
jgi:hypothetical protein